MPNPVRLKLVALEDRTTPTAALVLSNNTLIPIDTSFPTLPRAAVDVSGLGSGETLVGIDYRPKTGQLYGLTTNSGQGVRLYTLDPGTGQATPLTAAIVQFDSPPGTGTRALMGTHFGVDFDPTQDRLRVVTDTGLTFRMDPTSGQLVDGDANTPGTQPDPSGPPAEGVAYTNGTATAAVATEYTLDSGTDKLFIPAAAAGSGFAAGMAVTLNGQPLAFTGALGFDIPASVAVTTANAPALGSGTAALTVGGKTGLYAIDLTTAKSALIGLIGDGSAAPTGFALAPPGVSFFPTHLIAVGSGPGIAALVKVYNPDGSLRFTLTPYESSFTGGVQVATGDVTGDGVDDVITGTGVGGGPVVKVFDGATAQQLLSFSPYEDNFRGGVQVAAGDVNGDGFADIITGTGVGGGPRVRAFDGKTQGLLADFFAYESTFRGGVYVAAGDVTGGGKADIITGTGVGGGPRIQVFDPTGAKQLANFFAYESTFRGGVYVAAGDVDGNGVADVIAGTGPGGGPRVVAFDGASKGAKVIADFFAFDQSFRGGVLVGAVDRNGNGASDVVTGTGPGATNRVIVYGAGGTADADLQPFDANFTGGVFVA